MECDVAVLGGGPGGYTAAIRAAQLGAKVVCIEQEPELGGTCLRVGCIPTKAWVQTAHALHQARGDVREARRARRRAASSTSAAATSGRTRVVKQMTGGVAWLFKANGVEWVKGKGRFKDANTIAVEGGEDVTFKQRDRRDGLVPDAPADRRASTRRAASTRPACSPQTEVPRRLVVLGGGIIGCEFASIFQRFGSEVTIVEMLDTLIPQEDADAAKELAKQFGKRGIALQLGKQCTKVEDDGSQLTVHFGEGETVAGRPDARLGRPRRRSSRGSGSRRSASSSTGARASPTDEHRRTTVPHIYAVGDCAGYWQLAHTAFREGEVAAENACGHEATIGEPRRAAADLHRSRRSPASGSPRRRRASGTATTSRSACSPGSRTRAP